MNSEEENKTKDKKTPFFRQLIISIKDFDKYANFSKNTIGQTISYLLKLVAIFTLVIVITTLYKYSKEIEKAIGYINSNISTIEYKDEKLSVNNNEKLEITDNNSMLGKVIVDTSDLNEEQIQNYEDTLKDDSNYILLLKNKLIMKNGTISTSTTEYVYKNLLEKYKIESFDKQTIIDYYNNNKSNVYLSIGGIMFVYMFIADLTNVLLDSIILATIGFIIAWVAKTKIKYSELFNMSIHALTLPLLLNIIYIVINTFTGFVVKYFQVMYTTIAFIYIITAIFMIKSDNIKKQIDLQKIKDEQEEIKEKLQEQELEKKREEEKEDVKSKDKNDNNKKKKSKKKQEENSEPNVGNKPEGDNA